MSEPVAFHVVRRLELAAGGTSADAPYRDWTDPDGIAPMPAPKRRALLGNPCRAAGPAGADEPVSIIGLRGGAKLVVGRIDLVCGLLEVHGQPVPVYWGSNWYVPPEHRSSLVGVTLLLKMQGLHHTIGAHGPSQQALPVYEKMKFFGLPMTRWILLRRSRAVVERYVGRGPGARVVAPLADGGLLVQRTALGALRLARTSGARATIESRVPPGLAERLAAPCDRPVRAHRSGAYLDWLLANSFQDDARARSALVVLTMPDGVVAGYALLKVRFYPTATHRGFRDLLLGSLQDWGIFEPRAVAMLDIVLLAVRELGRMGVDAVEACLPADETPGAMRALGFVRVGAMTSVLRASAASPLHDPALQRPEAWRLRPADGDNFFV